MGRSQFHVCHCFSVLQWEAFSLPELNNFLRVLDREESEYMTELKHKYKFMKKIVQTRLKELRIERQQAASKKRDSYIQPAGPDHPLAQSSWWITDGCDVDASCEDVVLLSCDIKLSNQRASSHSVRNTLEVNQKTWGSLMHWIQFVTYLGCGFSKVGYLVLLWCPYTLCRHSPEWVCSEEPLCWYGPKWRQIIPSHNGWQSLVYSVFYT